MNIPSYNLLPFEVLAPVQALIRQAIQDETDASARVLDDMLASKPRSYQLTALAILHCWIHPYKEVH